MRDTLKAPLQKYIDQELKEIVITGARENNLKNLNITIPRDKLVVITGLSGSGKSSLAFDTLYAEGQRRYVECLSAYARQYLGMMKKPDVDRIEGLSPAISIEQKTISHNPRSTVGTTTEIYDYIRLLFAKIGTQYCTTCNIPVEKKSIDQIVNDIFAHYPEEKIQILTPLVKGRKGHYREFFEQLMKQGFTKVRIDGELTELVPGLKVNRYKIHNIELVVDRCIVENSQMSRIAESVELALQKGEGTMMLLAGKDNTEQLFSTNYSCPSCSKAYPQLSPYRFSFNSPFGSCPSCQGLGEKVDFSRSLVIPDDSLSIAEGGIAILGKKRDMWIWTQLNAFVEEHNIDLDKAIKDLKTEELNLVLYGSKTEITVEYQFSNTKKINYKHKFAGVLPTFRSQYETTNSGLIKRKIEEFMSSQICEVCNGGRLKPENLAVLIDKHSVADISSYDITASLEFFENVSSKLTDKQNAIAKLILKEIVERLKFLEDVGLTYLNIGRSVKTLSGGESQRIRLASQIGSKLVGIMYILDEPSIGLHQHDNYKLIQSLKDLRDLGNTVIVVEHDKAMIEESDYLIDVGPGAGIHGGNIIVSTNPGNIKHLNKDTLSRSYTAQYLSGDKSIPTPVSRREGNGSFLELLGATGNNLQNVDLRIPLGTFTCVTGMSGSGKSSLINDTLYPILSRHFYRSTKIPLPYKTINGLEHIDKVIEIDQSPIGRTPRSNPATYTGLFTLIRDFYALLPESKIRGYQSGRFSFNVKGGRCEECEGAGLKKIEMNFLPEVYVECEVCNGKRYNMETLSVTFKNKSIADVLDMTVEEATIFFKDIPKIHHKLQTLMDVGLTYIKLGQQAPTLSGGEAQRVKLATELSKRSTGKTLYLLDEPTTGLHFEDINILLKLIHKLVDKGNTAIIIEHNLDVIKCADRIIDLGPEGGRNGGKIIEEGTPEEIAKSKISLTGKYLKDEL